MEKEVSKTLNTSDNLHLTNFKYPELPNDILFPDELNSYLREQIQYLIHENGMLKKNLSDNETNYGNSQLTIDELKQKLDYYEKICNKNEFVSSSQMASCKIVELSKQLREKYSEVESLKTKCSKLEKVIFEMKQQDNLQSSDTKYSTTISEKTTNLLLNPNNDENETKKLQEKNSILQSKLSEAKNLNLQLKNEVKLANKLLQQEIGESFESIQALNSTSSSVWRGRAQIIRELQLKNSELKDKLRSHEKANPSLSLSSTQSKAENKVFLLTKEIKELKFNIEELKRKIESLKARNRVVDSEYSTLKIKFETLKEKADHDQELIATLAAQVTNRNNNSNDTLKQKESVLRKQQKDNEVLKEKIHQLQCTVDNLTKELKERIEENKNLLNNSGNVKIQIDEECMNRVTNEKRKLLQLLDVLNNRIEAERGDHEKTQQLLRQEKQRVAKLESAVSRMEVDQNSLKTSSYSYVTINSTSTCKAVDRTNANQLELAEEQIKVLQTRLEIEQQERKKDFQEFMKIVEDYEFKQK